MPDLGRISLALLYRSKLAVFILQCQLAFLGLLTCVCYWIFKHIYLQTKQFKSYQI